MFCQTDHEKFCMQLTRYTDYGLRILIYLALLPEEKLASIDTISQTYDISRNNVNKIVHQLGREGIIETKRGKGGGFRLNQPASDINIGDLVVMLENTMLPVDCSSPVCRILPACKLKKIFHEAMQAFIDSLSAYTLADLLDSKKANLIEILELTAEN